MHAASGASQALYRETVVTAISGEQNTIVLVGHSFGIVTISNVTETIKFGVDTRNLPVLTNPQGRTGEPAPLARQCHLAIDHPQMKLVAAKITRSTAARLQFVPLPARASHGT
jgi:hypothetical protein